MKRKIEASTTDEKSGIKTSAVLQKSKTNKSAGIQRTLPGWITDPDTFSQDVKQHCPLNELQMLDTKLSQLLHDKGFISFFPVQKAVIPHLVRSFNPLSIRYRPRDICVSAPTGSGKTLAFVLPIINCLIGRKTCKIKALILLPVVELAIQVHSVFKMFASEFGLNIGLAVGSNNFEEEQALLVKRCSQGYRSLVDVLITTPGRFIDHVNKTDGLDFSELRFLVLDEVDRLLSEEGGFWLSDIESVINKRLLFCPGNYSLPNYLFQQALTSDQELLQLHEEQAWIPGYPLQKLLFSATLCSDTEKLQKLRLYKPRLFFATKECSTQCVSNELSNTDELQSKVTVLPEESCPFVRPPNLREEFIIADSQMRPLVIHHLILTRKWKRVLIFTNSVSNMHKLALLLFHLSVNFSYKVAEFPSHMIQLRDLVMSHFRSGEINILVATDAMARGLDVLNINAVISYDIPSPQTYIHRIGRTARAGKSGTGLTIVDQDSVKNFLRIMKQTGGTAVNQAFSPCDLDVYEGNYKIALRKMKQSLLKDSHAKRKAKLLWPVGVKSNRLLSKKLHMSSKKYGQRN